MRPPRLIRSLLVFSFALSLGTAWVPAAAQDVQPLTLDRLYASGELFGRGIGQVRWLEDGGYTQLARSEAVQGGMDLMRVDPRTGDRTVLLSARQLIPAGSERPIRLEGYTWSDDGQKLLVFTNSQRVWRSNTRGDYWVLDRASGRLQPFSPPAPAGEKKNG